MDGNGRGVEGGKEGKGEERGGEGRRGKVKRGGERNEKKESVGFM